jgi:hypothetical protein
MSRGCQRINQSDLIKAVKAAVAAGVPAKVEVEKDGRIIVHIGGKDQTEPAPDPNEWATTDDQN